MTNEAYDAGMREQLRRFHEALDGGMPRLGWKVALSDPAILERLGLSQSAIAWLDGNRRHNPGDEYRVPAGARAAVEAEVAIRMGPDAMVDEVAPAIEFIDRSRPGGALEAILGHAVFHEAVMLGAPRPFGEWAAQHWPPDAWPVITKNGEAAASLTPAMAPVDFRELAAAKAAQLAESGEGLEAGDWIITGSLTTPVPVEVGDQIVIDFGPLGELSTRIGAAR